MIDVNKPVTNPELVAAIDALQKDPSADNVNVFFELLKNAHFLVPLEGGLKHDEPDSDGKITLKEGTEFQLPLLSDSQNNLWYIAFTDWPTLRSWRNIPDEETLILPFSDFCGIILREENNIAGILINPGSHSLPVDRSLLGRLSGRIIPMTVKKDTPVLIGEPADYPHKLVEAMRSRLKSIRKVKRAWLLLMHKENEQCLLVVVDFEDDIQDNHRKIFAAIGQTAVDHPQPLPIDMIALNGPFGMNAVKNREPFYEKKKRGLFNIFH